MPSEPPPDTPEAGVSGPDFLTAFNTARSAAAEAMLRPCLDIPRWCNEIAAARPFATPGELLSFAELAAPDFTEAEVDGALAHHPRIGERPDGERPAGEGAVGEHPTDDGAAGEGAAGEHQAGTGAAATGAAFSRSEQASVRGLADARDRLGAGNRAYEDKFGRVFLIRAAGRSAEEILAALEDRLQHTADEELPVVAAQLRDIAILRLEGLLHP